ncbi:hypothetical protein OHA98_42440 [Streptomyces sp. NBC_00654]|nr:hypothetical protein [Streptomyces sp. NBC_00654]MCX4971261.1 hypothetical protein [Streptomyces sp. NBC_00654]
MRNGWPAHELVARTDIEPARTVVSRLRLLDKLLPGSDEPYVIPAREAATGIAAGPVFCAAGCGAQFPHVAQVRPGTVCRDCRTETATAHYAQAAGAYGTDF